MSIEASENSNEEWIEDESENVSDEIHSLSVAPPKRIRKDEYYAQLRDIENELRHYKEDFRDKVVYCNCDDSRASNFFKYFFLNFKHLGLKKLIATTYRDLDPDTHTEMLVDKAISMEYNGEPDGSHIPNINNVIIRNLEGDGDFRSEESIELLKQADIVVSYPPPSQVSKYLAQLIEYDKKFLFIGATISTLNKDTFSLLKEGKMWLGYSTKTSMEVGIPDDNPTKSKVRRIDDEGNRVVNAEGVAWYTNFGGYNRRDNMVLFMKYDPKIHKEYDNYNAIHIKRKKNVLVDYDGLMSVPYSFIVNYNPEQFELVGIVDGSYDYDKEAWPTKKYINVKRVNFDGPVESSNRVNSGAALALDKVPRETFYVADNSNKVLITAGARVLIRHRRSIVRSELLESDFDEDAPDMTTEDSNKNLSEQNDFQPTQNVMEKNADLTTEDIEETVYVVTPVLETTEYDVDGGIIAVDSYSGFWSENEDSNEVAKGDNYRPKRLKQPSENGSDEPLEHPKTTNDFSVWEAMGNAWASVPEFHED